MGLSEIVMVCIAIVAIIVLIIYVKKDARNEDTFAKSTTILAELGSIRASLGEITSIKLDLNNTKNTVSTIMDRLIELEKSLVGISQYLETRTLVDVETSNNVQSIKNTLNGVGTKGKAGEYLVELALSKLPTEWVIKNFNVGNKVVEFGINLPNGKILPIDSKWTASEFPDSDDPEVVKNKLTTILKNRAKEMKKYLDPSVTYHMGIIAVPDSLNGIIADAQSELVNENIVIIPYGFLLPYVLLVYNYTKDAKEIRGDEIVKSANSIQEIMEGKFSKAITMITNARDETRIELSKIIANVRE
jgi:DNA recombination protein RmuC